MKIEDVNVRQYEEVCHIAKCTERDDIDKICDIAKVLKIEGYENMYSTDLVNIIQPIWEINSENLIDPPNEIEIDGYNYILKNDIRNRLPIGIEKMINSFVKTSPTNLFGKLLAISYEKEVLGSNEHFLPAHIKVKESLFNNQPSITFIKYFSDFLFQKNKELKEIKDKIEIENEKQINDANQEVVGGSIV